MFRPLLTSILVMAVCSTASAQSYQCKTSDYGGSCGPSLKATCTPNGNTHRVSLTVKDANPGSNLILMVGVQKAGIPLSWIFLNTKTNCDLLLLPIFIQQHKPNSAGHYTMSRAVPSNWVGTGHVQFLEFQPSGKVLATNGATITRG
jgi:hypothetical protein